MVTLAIPNFGQRVSPRFDYAESLQLVSIEESKIKNRETIKLLVHSNLERLNIVTRLNPDVLICDGISDLSREKLNDSKIKVIAWVHGEIDEILEKYMNGLFE
jgi:predicted Fe-Mo cluster-binding NifX family protein